uniref:Uncharacterized protein n=1 Tax=Arundo donax TaxID=35708 RepID=A0A0A8YW60_ARUDO
MCGYQLSTYPPGTIKLQLPFYITRFN